MPENLTTWRIKVWGMGHGTRVGQGFADVVTRKDLIVRLEAPRFFVQTDEVVLSAIVHNYLKTKKTVQVALELGGNCLELADRSRHGLTGPLALLGGNAPIRTSTLSPTARPASIGASRCSTRVKPSIRVKALTDEESDAMEQKFPCYIHGMLKMDSYSGSIRPNQESGKFTVTVPEKRQPAQSRLEVR